MKICRALAALLAVALFPAAVSPAALPPGVTPDALTQGVLPNGIRYAILPHASPRGEVSLRLIVQTGSLDEAPRESGYAHFVEHMAFNGTRHHPPGTLVAFFQAIGVRWGSDLNAETTSATTIYKLDLPAEGAAHFDEALQLLRDDADGLLFVPAEVEREKGVVLSEAQARDLPARRMSRELRNIIFAGTPVAGHETSGAPADIRDATADSLRAFYERCYLPERMIVVIVGPVDPAQTGDKIAREFGSIPRRDGPRPIAASLSVPGSPLDVHQLVNPAQSTASVFLLSVTSRPPQTDEGDAEAISELLAMRVLHRRAQEFREAHADRLGVFNATTRPDVANRLLVHSIEVHTATKSWAYGVQVTADVLEKARKEGFAADEVREAATVLLNAAHSHETTINALSSPSLAADLVSPLMADRTWHDAKTTTAILERTLPSLDAARVTGTLRRIFPSGAEQIVITLPRPVEGLPNDTLAIWRREVAAIPTPAVKTAAASEVAELKFAYDGDRAPGEIASMRVEKDLRLTLVAFKNGALLNLRPSELHGGTFILRARLGNGTADIPRNRPGIVTTATELIRTNELSRHSATELSRLMALRNVRLAIDSSDGCASVTIAGPATEARFALQLLTAWLEDLTLDSKHDRQVLSRSVAAMRSITGRPTSFAMFQAIHDAAGRDSRLMPLAQADGLTTNRLAEIKQWVTRCWLHGPIEVGMVGDFVPADVVAIAAATLGTLAPRAARSEPAAEERLSFGTPAGTKVRRTSVSAGAAAAFIVWPAPFPPDLKTRRALNLAADVLKERLQQTFREELGATYSPLAMAMQTPSQPRFTFLAAQLTFAPDKARMMTDRVLELANGLARTGATAEEFERLRQPRIATCEGEIHDDSWWLAIVATNAQTRPEGMEEARTHLNGYKELTIEDVNNALRVLVTTEATAVIARPPSVPKPTEAESKS